MGTGVVPFKVQDVFNVSTPPAVDTLVGIPDDADVFILVRQHVDQLILGVVGVLVLVDVDVVEAVLVEFQRFRVLLKQLDGLHNQVVKVEGLVGL